VRMEKARCRRCDRIDEVRVEIALVHVDARVRRRRLGHVLRRDLVALERAVRGQREAADSRSRGSAAARSSYRTMSFAEGRRGAARDRGPGVGQVDLDPFDRKADGLGDVERQADDEVRLALLDLHERVHQAFERELVRGTPPSRRRRHRAVARWRFRGVASWMSPHSRNRRTAGRRGGSRPSRHHSNRREADRKAGRRCRRRRRCAYALGQAPSRRPCRRCHRRSPSSPDPWRCSDAASRPDIRPGGTTRSFASSRSPDGVNFCTRAAVDGLAEVQVPPGGRWPTSAGR